MPHYELLIILPPNWEPKDLEREVARLREVVGRFSGQIVQEARWGQRRLAYQIQKDGEGY